MTWWRGHEEVTLLVGYLCPVVWQTVDRGSWPKHHQPSQNSLLSVRSLALSNLVASTWNVCFLIEKHGFNTCFNIFPKHRSVSNISSINRLIISFQRALSPQVTGVDSLVSFIRKWRLPQNQSKAPFLKHSFVFPELDNRFRWFCQCW